MKTQRHVRNLYFREESFRKKKRKLLETEKKIRKILIPTLHQIVESCIDFCGAIHFSI